MRRSHRKVIFAAAIAVTAAAVVKELRTPRERRTWHGKVAGAVPYDFRKPTASRLRRRWWNADAPILTPRAFGVGWDVNFGRAVSELRRAVAQV